MKKSILIILLGILAGITYSQDLASANISVTNFDNDPIIGAQIEFFDTKKNTIIKGVSNQKGALILDLPAGLYNIRLKSVGKAKDYSAIEIPELADNEVYNDVNIIIQYAEENSFTLSDLHFETAKATIKSSSFEELNELVNYLELKKELKIEVGGHTDSNGSDISNLQLSQARADAVRDYLMKKGIGANRVIAKGYGEKKPIAENNSDHGRALNRRTEINAL